MRSLFLLLIVAALSLNSNVNAQRTCHTMDHLQEQLLQDPTLFNQMQQIEQHTQQFALSENDNQRDGNVITIPVVVHIVWKTAAQNLSQAQIQSQMDVLNEDFRRLNSDASQTISQFQGVAADIELEFCLATTDPQGNTTDGIVRTQTTVNQWNGDQIKSASQGGSNAWPAGSYLNMWVGNLGGGILGWATFPGGNASQDGVVINTVNFGSGGTAQAPFDLGRTATHEVGHWLNLYHIWGDGGCNQDDNVSDTPASNQETYGCNLSKTTCNSLDMVQNYMDYSDDACMNLFTTGQKTRMRALFSSGGAR